MDRVKKVILRIVSFVLSLCMIFNLLVTSTYASTAPVELDKALCGCELEYSIDNEYEGGYNATVTIKNNSDKIVNNWCVTFVFVDKIVNIWNAEIVEHIDNNYTVKNAQWNQDIPAYGSVSFGFAAEGTGEVEPSNLKFVGVENVVENDGYVVEYGLYGDWGEGFSAYIKITNIGTVKIEDWSLEFDFARNINTMWNGSIVSWEDNHYIITNTEYNQNIDIGKSVIIGFNGTSGNANDVANNFVLNSYDFTTIAEDIEDTKVQIDTDKLYSVGTGAFYLPDNFENLQGTVKNIEAISTLIYTNRNINGKVLDCGEITIAENWIIKDIPLVLGYNEITVTAKYNNGEVYTDVVTLANEDESRMNGINIDLADDDNDGLNNYLEELYGTDKKILTLMEMDYLIMLK